MQLPQQTGIGESDLKNAHDFDFFTFAGDAPSWRLVLAIDNAIRGSPPWDDPPGATPSILLTTQRLRI